jgi:hypothetical protein
MEAKMFHPGMLPCDLLARHLHDERLGQAGQPAWREQEPAPRPRLAWRRQPALRPALLMAGMLAVLVMFWLVEVAWAA